MGENHSFHYRSETRKGHPLLPLLFHNIGNTGKSNLGRERIKGIKIESENIKIFMFASDMEKLKNTI